MVQFRVKPEKKKNSLSREKILGKDARDKWAAMANNESSSSCNEENQLRNDHAYYIQGKKFIYL